MINLANNFFLRKKQLGNLGLPGKYYETLNLPPED